MGKYENENVLVVSRELFDQLGAFDGICFDTDRYLPSLLNPANNYFLSRDLAEHDPGHKQIIPYVIFRHGDKYLHYVRGSKGGETRLHAKGSIGIGGHVNDTDYASSSLDTDTYSTGVEREIHEELNLSGTFRRQILALINDDSNEVGQVHLGIVHLFDLETDQVTAREASIQGLSFLTLAELLERHENLESWSQICLDGLLQAPQQGIINDISSED